MENVSKSRMSKFPLNLLQRLKLRKEGSSELMDYLEEALIVFDEKLNFVRINATARALFDVLGIDVEGKNILDVLPDIKETERYKEYLKVIRTGKSYSAADIIPSSRFGNVHLNVKVFKVGNGLGMIVSDITGRKKLEQELKESEEKYRAIVETSPDGIYQVDTSGKLTFMNKPFADTFGDKPEDLLGKHFSYLLSPGTFPRIKEMVDKVLSGENVKTEIPIQHRKGHEVVVSFSATPVKVNGKITGLTGILRDMTERKETDKELAKSEAKYRSLIETAGAGVATIDLKGELVLVNEAFCRMIGYLQEELLGRNFADFLHPDDKENVLDKFAGGLAGRQEHPILEFRVIHKDGHNVWCHSSPTRIIQGDETAGFSAIIYDITERKKVEEALRESEKRYRQLYKSLMDSFASVDMDGRITEFNDAFSKMVGYAPEELYYLTYDDLTPEKWHAVEAEVINHQVLTRGYSDLYEKEYHRKDGTVFPVELRTNLMRDDAGSPCGMWAIVRDITERKKAEEALRDSEEKWRSLTENSPDYIILLDLDSTILFINRTVPDLTKEEVIGTPNFKYIPQEYRQSVADCYKRVAASGKPDMHTTVYRTKEGESRWFEVRVGPVFKNGQVVAFVSSSTDITERKKTEETLRVSEERYHSFVQNFLGIAYQGDREFKPDFFHGAIENITGYTEKEFLDGEIRWPDIIHKEDLGQVLEKIKERIALQHVSGELEYRIIRKNGQVRWIYQHFRDLFDGSGNAIGSQGTISDITERKKMEETLRKSEKKYRQLVESMQEGLWGIDKDSYTTFVNARMAEMFGYRADEMLGKHLFEFMDERGVEIAKGLLERRQQGIKEQHDFEFIRKDGARVYASLETSPISDADGHYIGALACVADITERRKVEEETRYQANLIENVSDAIISTDLDFNIISWNKAAENTYGWRADDVIGKPLAHFAKAEYPYDQGEQVLEQFRATGSWKGEVIQRHKDGAPINIMASVTVLKDSAGNSLGVVAINRDITERKKGEEALRESEQRFRNVLDNSLDMVYRLNLQTGTYDYVSPSTEKILGYSPEEFVAFTIEQGRSLAHPDDLAMLDENVIELVTSTADTASSIEYRIRHKEQGYRWVSDSRSVVYDNGNNPVAVVGNLRDITEREKEAEALRGSEEKYRLLAENVTDVIWTMDTDLRFTYISPSVMRLRGLTVEEAMAERLEDIFSPSSFRALVEAFEEGMVAEATGLRDPSRSWALELEEYCKDGSLIWVDIRAGLLRDQEGRPVGLVGVTRDITQRKKAEDRLRESEARYKNLVALAPDAIMTMDLDGIVISWNISAERITGYSADEMIGKHYSDFGTMPPEDAPRYSKIFESLPSGQVPETFEAAVLHKDGAHRLVDVKVGLIEKGGKCVGLQVISRDITERKRAEEALKQSEERYRALVNTAGLAGEGIMIVERAEGDKAVIAFVNDTLAVMLGYQREEMLGMTARDLFLPGDRTWLQDKSRRRRKGEALPSHSTVMASRKDGSMLPIEISMGAMRYQDKNATVVYVRDVTVRKQAEESLRESEAQFRAIFDGAAIGVGLLDVNGRTFRINAALREMLGYTVEELRSMAFTDYMHPDDATVDAGLFQEIVRGKRDHYQVEKRYIKKDGQMAWGRMTLSAVRGPGGKLLFAIGMVENITESKLALENLRRSEERFRSLIENASEVVLIVDKDAIIRYESSSGARILGYKLEEAIGQESLSFIHQDDLPEVMNLYNKILQNPGGTVSAKVRVRHKDGSWRVAEGMGKNLIGDPAVSGIVVNFRDVTERERAQEELLRHTKRVEALHAVAQLASQTLELEELLDTSLDEVIGVMEAEAGCVYLLDIVEKELVLRTSRGLSDETISRLATIKLNEDNIQKIKEWKGGSTPLRKIFEETGLNITKEAKEKEQIQSFAVAPFAVRGQLSGLVAVGNRAYRKFSPGDIDLLREVGNQIGIGTQNAMLYEEVRALIRETIDVQETERERICLEVHDGVAQTLVSAFQYLQALEAAAPDDAQTKQLFAKTSAQVKLAIQESREVINSLRPSTLSDLGLVSTLRHELKRLEKETGLKIDFKADAIRLPKDIETGLYRIIHEAVSNARKHANTRRLRVKINSGGERVRVEVRDWGKGFDLSYLGRASKRGTGLFSIRKRAELMKGDCEIQSEPGQGTTVRVEIPVSAADGSSG